MEMEEEQAGRESSWTGILPPELQSLLSLASNSVPTPTPPTSGWRYEDNDGRPSIVRISELTERQYLTMNWWLLNVGWKVVMELVQDAVSDVFNGYETRHLCVALRN